MQIKCKQCDKEFICKADAPDERCWCFDLAKVIPVPDASDEAACLCPKCLELLIMTKSGE